MQETQMTKNKINKTKTTQTKMLVAVATMYEYLAWHREDVSWAQNQHSSLKFK
jgi:hypothetical protein